MVINSARPKKSISYEVKQHMKRLAIIMTAVLVFALGTFAVIANQDAQSTTGATGQYSADPANAVTAEGGDVTENNVESNATTTKWQGFWGNVSGSLQLGDGTDTFYDWSGVTFQAIYASPNNAPDWGSLNGGIDLTDVDTAFGFTSSDTDSVNSTFAGAACTAGTEIAGAPGATPLDNNGDPGDWITCVAEDTTAVGVAIAVFGTDITTGTGFNGDTIDYQLMVPAEAATTDYYFFLEI